MTFEDEYKILAPKLEQSIEQGYDVNTLHRGIRSLLHGAAQFDDVDTAILLVKNHADVEIKDNRYQTPLHVAANSDSYRVARTLIGSGADINAPNKYKDMPIHIAADAGSLNVLKLLITNGANVNARDGKNNTPLHGAVRMSCVATDMGLKDNIPVIEELINRGANLSAADSDGNTPLHEAARNGSEEIIDKLQRAGADENVKNSYGEKPEDCVFDLGSLYLGETLKKIIDNEVRAHIQTLSRKLKQLIKIDDYGIEDRTKWKEELGYFVMQVLVPKLDPSNAYIRYILHSIDESSDNYISARDSLVEAVENAVNKAVDEVSSEYGGGVYSESMDPVEYESMCAGILSDNGWNARLTSASGDQGVDVFAEKDGCSVVLQCKKYTSPVGNKAVQEAHSGRGFMGASAAVVVTNTSYTQSARQLASALGVLLLHHDELADISSKLQL